eukprot:scaffold3889_cov80-Skeletonema_dohrnii-CCMP3373.AAC.1
MARLSPLETSWSSAPLFASAPENKKRYPKNKKQQHHHRKQYISSVINNGAINCGETGSEPPIGE